MLDRLTAEYNAQHCRVGDLLDEPFGAYCSTSIWSALLNRLNLQGSAMLNTSW